MTLKVLGMLPRLSGKCKITRNMDKLDDFASQLGLELARRTVASRRNSY